MAVSTIAGYTGGGTTLTCILKEGNLTYADYGHGADGYYEPVVTIASPIKKGDWVVLSEDTANTYAATKGIPVVKAIAAGTLDIGVVVSEPEWVKVPTASQNTWSSMLTGQYYRIASVTFPSFVGVAKAVLDGQNAANIVPGIGTTLKVDASASTALSGGPVTLCVIDAVSGGTASLIPLHYAAASTSDYSMMVAFTGGPAVIGA